MFAGNLTFILSIRSIGNRYNMNELLWKIPVPSSSLGEGPVFEEIVGRDCSISFKINSRRGWQITFKGVEAYKCHYYHACTAEMIDTSYDRLIDIRDSSWLNALRTQLTKYGDDIKDLRHLMIYFDDGPCYELICRSFSTDEVYY